MGAQCKFLINHKKITCHITASNLLEQVQHMHQIIAENKGQGSDYNHHLNACPTEQQVVHTCEHQLN